MPQNILVVDDNEDNYLVVKHMLKKAGYHGLYANNGVKAMKMLTSQKIDLVLLDWMMPEMSGIHVCREIKDDSRTNLIPVIMLSAKTASEDIEEGLDAGADDYAVKPVVKSELFARIRASLRIHDLQTKLDSQLKGVADIQQQLLPVELPESEDFKVGTFYKPSEGSGGDYYDIFKIGDRYTAFVVADVSGHGAPAMVCMALTRSFLKLLNAEEVSPSKALVTLTNVLFDHLPTSQYVTMFYSIFDHQDKVLRYATAGHPAPYYFIKRANAGKPLPVKPGFPLKLFQPESEYPEGEMHVEKGDGMLLYTDGYSDAVTDDGRRLGALKMGEIFVDATKKADPLDHIVTQWHLQTGHVEQSDDVTLLYVQF